MTETRATYATARDAEDAAARPPLFFVTIHGNPIPKGRPRVAGHAYTPQRTREYEALVRDTVALLWRRDPLKLAVAVTLRFYRDSARRVDLDNLVKSTVDAIQGVILEDDSQVWCLHAEKAIDRESPRVELLVEVI